MRIEEKAVKNLQAIGIEAKQENGTVYVEVNEHFLELAIFEIEFQADEYDKKK